MSAISVVDDPSEITAEWCTELLRRPVAAVEVEPLSDVPGYFSRLFRLLVAFAGGETQSLVAKLASSEMWNRTLGFHLTFFQSEFQFYEELAAKLPVRVPAYHGGAIDVDSQRFVIVLEDLGGARSIDQSSGCAEAEAALAVDELARLHAEWWEAPGLDDLGWLLTPTTNAEGVAMGFDMACDGFLSTHGNALPSAATTAAECLRGRVGELLGALSAGGGTLVHGDIRLDNLVFGHGGDERPLMFDWQSVMRGSGLFDVAELLCLALPTETRRHCERRLLERYVARLAEAGIKVSYDDAFEQYRLGALFTYSLGVSQTLTLTEQQGSDVGVWIQRTAQAVADLGVPAPFA